MFRFDGEQIENRFDELVAVIANNLLLIGNYSVKLGFGLIQLVDGLQHSKFLNRDQASQMNVYRPEINCKLHSVTSYHGSIVEQCSYNMI